MFILEVLLSEDLKDKTEEEISTTIDSSHSFFSSAYMTKYFNPTRSMDVGYSDYNIPRWIQRQMNYTELRYNAYAMLQLNQCTYFDNFFIDLSQFGSIFGNDCTTYAMTDT